MGVGPGRVLCDDILRRRMRTCALSVSSTVGRSVDPSTTSRHFGGETKRIVSVSHVVSFIKIGGAEPPPLKYWG